MNMLEVVSLYVDVPAIVVVYSNCPVSGFQPPVVLEVELKSSMIDNPGTLTLPVGVFTFSMLADPFDTNLKACSHGLWMPSI